MSYKKIYLDHFGYTEADWIPCEICRKTAVDIHHIKARGMGGSKKADFIENLMALCRSCHIKYGDKKQYVEFLIEKHNALLQRNSS